jgi:predicted actin-binding protein
VSNYSHKRLGFVASGIVIALGATLAAVAMAAGTRAAAAPTNTSPPAISGTPQQGSTLTASNGNWDGSTPITFQYQWRRCDANGGSCSDISGATAQTYVLQSIDVGNALRVRVIASNADGSSSSSSAPSAKIAGPTATTTAVTTTVTTTTTPAPPATGCPTAQGGAAVSAAAITAPAHLLISGFQSTPGVIPGNVSSFTLRVTVSDTCGQLVQGALVYATAVPFRQFTIPPEAATGSDGSVTLTFNRQGGFPASSHQQLLALFVRARKAGDNVLAGISARRLVSTRVHL